MHYYNFLLSLICLNVDGILDNVFFDILCHNNACYYLFCAKIITDIIITKDCILVPKSYIVKNSTADWGKSSA